MTTCHMRCRQLLKIVNLLFFGSVAFFLFLSLIASLGGYWFAGIALLPILALPLSSLLAVGGIILSLWCAIREKNPKGWIMVLGFLPAGALAAAIFCALLYAGSHY